MGSEVASELRYNHPHSHVVLVTGRRLSMVLGEHPLHTDHMATRSEYDEDCVSYKPLNCELLPRFGLADHCRLGTWRTLKNGKFETDLVKFRFM